MFLSVVQLVLAPVIVGTTLNQFLPRVSQGRLSKQPWGS
jgi:predicted Na+-dependent transporter